MKKVPTQKERLLKHLKSGKSITRLQGWDKLGILELPARISELRAGGWPIQTKMKTVKNRYGESVHIAVWSMPAKGRDIVFRTDGEERMRIQANGPALFRDVVPESKISIGESGTGEGE